MTVTLITGANKGLGYHTAKELLKAGHVVWVAGRDSGRVAEAAKALGAGAKALTLDAVKTVADSGTGLDVLINNAGITGSPNEADDFTVANFEKVYVTNVFGVVRVTAAFTPLLDASSCPVVVNVSSTLGSLKECGPGGPYENFGRSYQAYGSSKSAVNMITVTTAKAHPTWRVNAICPGYTATELTGGQGHPVEVGASIMVDMAKVKKDGSTATFSDRNGPVAW